MYQQNDYDENRQQLRARSLTVGLPMAALLALAVVSFLLRWPQGVTMALCFLFCAVGIFGYTMLISPVRAYGRHIAHALTGRTRQTSGVFVSMDEASVTRENVDFYPVTLNVGDQGREEDDRLFYMDANLPRPDWQAGETLTLVLSADTELTEDLTVPAGVELVVRNPYTSSGATSPKTGAVLYAASAGGASSGSASSGGISAGTSSTVELAVASGVTLTANYDLRLEDVSMTVHGQVTTRGNTHNAGALCVESDGVWENHGNIYCYGGLDLYGKLQNYGMVLAMREETSGGLILRDGWISLQNGSQWDLNSGSIGCMSALNGAISGYGDGYEMSEADSNDFCWLQAQTVTQPDGDVNGDGTVDTADLDALVRHVACIEELGDLSRADIDGDGDIDADDITVLAQMLQQMGVVD